MVRGEAQVTMALQMFGRARAEVARAQTADGVDDFAALYRSLFTPAMRVAYRITGSRETAEDVAAEALARAYAQWREVRAMPHRESWVMRVASNLALDAARRRRPAEKAQRALEHAYGDGCAGERAEDAVVTRLALVAALRQLPARQRDAVVLYYLGGLSEAEVSASLGIATSSVRTHLQRGLGKLRAHLAHDDPEEVLRG